MAYSRWSSSSWYSFLTEKDGVPYLALWHVNYKDFPRIRFDEVLKIKSVEDLKKILPETPEEDYEEAMEYVKECLYDLKLYYAIGDYSQDTWIDDIEDSLSEKCRERILVYNVPTYEDFVKVCKTISHVKENVERIHRKYFRIKFITWKDNIVNMELECEE